MSLLCDSQVRNRLRSGRNNKKVNNNQEFPFFRFFFFFYNVLDVCDSQVDVPPLSVAALLSPRAAFYTPELAARPSLSHSPRAGRGFPRCVASSCPYMDTEDVTGFPLPFKERKRRWKETREKRGEVRS